MTASDIRSDDARRASFERIVAPLDQAIAAARPALAAAGVAVEDECDRGQFDPHWYRTFRWRYRFVRRGTAEGCVVRVAAAVSYEEPLDTTPPPAVRCAVLAEVFSVGQPSFVRWTDDRELPAASWERGGLSPIVLDALARGTARLPEVYARALTADG